MKAPVQGQADSDGVLMSAVGAISAEAVDRMPVASSDVDSMMADGAGAASGPRSALPPVIDIGVADDSRSLLLVDHSSYKNLAHQQTLLVSEGSSAASSSGAAKSGQFSRRRFWLSVRLGLTREAVVLLRKTAGAELKTVHEAYTAIISALRCIMRFEDGETEVVGFNSTTGASQELSPLILRLASDLPTWVSSDAWPTADADVDARSKVAAAAGAASASNILAVVVETKGESLPITSEYHNRRFRLGFFLKGQPTREPGGEAQTLGSLVGSPGGLQELIARGPLQVSTVTGSTEMAGLGDLPPMRAIAWTAAIEVMGKQKAELQRQPLAGTEAYTPPAPTPCADRLDPFTAASLRALHTLHRISQIGYLGAHKGAPRDGGIAESYRMRRLLPQDHNIEILEWTMDPSPMPGLGILYRQGRDALNEKYSTADLPLKIRLPVALALAPLSKSSTPKISAAAASSAIVAASLSHSGSSRLGHSGLRRQRADTLDDRASDPLFGPLDFATLSTRISISLVSFDFTRLREYVTSEEKQSGTLPEFRNIPPEDLDKLHERTLVPFSVFDIADDGRTVTIAIERKNWPVSSRHADRPMRLVVTLVAGELSVTTALAAARAVAGLRPERDKRGALSSAFPGAKIDAAAGEVSSSAANKSDSKSAVLPSVVVDASPGLSASSSGLTSDLSSSVAASSSRGSRVSNSSAALHRAGSNESHFAPGSPLDIFHQAVLGGRRPSSSGKKPGVPVLAVASVKASEASASAAPVESERSATPRQRLVPDALAVADPFALRDWLLVSPGSIPSDPVEAAGNIAHREGFSRLSVAQATRLVNECGDLLRSFAIAWSDPFEIKAKAPASTKAEKAAAKVRSSAAAAAVAGDDDTADDKSEDANDPSAAGGAAKGLLPTWVTVPSIAVKGKTRGLRDNAQIISSCLAIMAGPQAEAVGGVNFAEPPETREVTFDATHRGRRKQLCDNWDEVLGYSNEDEHHEADKNELPVVIKDSTEFGIEGSSDGVAAAKTEDSFQLKRASGESASRSSAELQGQDRASASSSVAARTGRKGRKPAAAPAADETKGDKSGTAVGSAYAAEGGAKRAAPVGRRGRVATADKDILPSNITLTVSDKRPSVTVGGNSEKVPSALDRLVESALNSPHDPHDSLSSPGSGGASGPQLPPVNLTGQHFEGFTVATAPSLLQRRFPSSVTEFGSASAAGDGHNGFSMRHSAIGGDPKSIKQPMSPFGAGEAGGFGGGTLRPRLAVVGFQDASLGLASGPAPSNLAGISKAISDSGATDFGSFGDGRNGIGASSSLSVSPLLSHVSMVSAAPGNEVVGWKAIG